MSYPDHQQATTDHFAVKSQDFPFDLNNLFTLSYSFDILKQTIEFLAKTQAAHSKMLSHLADSAK